MISVSIPCDLRSNGQVLPGPRRMGDAMIFEIAGNVPEDQVDLIKHGFDLAQSYLAREMGGDIPADVRAGSRSRSSTRDWATRS